MRRIVWFALVSALTLAGCGGNYPQGGPLYRSWDHLKYSWHRGKPPLTEKDLKEAQEQGWWGNPVDYTQQEVRR